MRRKISRFEKIARKRERRIAAGPFSGKKRGTKSVKRKSGRKHGWWILRAGTDIRRCGETIWDTVGAIRDGDEVSGCERSEGARGYRESEASKERGYGKV